MAFRADLSAWLMQKSAPLTVGYGKDLVLAGADLPAPTRIRVPTRHGRVRCDVYRPAAAQPDPPVYVHLHGGAFVMRYPRMDDFFARYVAATCDAVVVNVDYDVAPQARYPVAQEQAHDVAAWVARHGPALDADGGRVAVGGFSAGGNLAASAALQARDLDSFTPVLQVLGVPALDVAADLATKTSLVARPMIGPSTLRLVRSTYFREEGRRAEPYASPLLAADLVGVAAALVVTAEYDVLRAEGDAYAARLAEDGVAVTHHVVPGRDHYFLDGEGPSGARATLEMIGDRLRAAFA